MIQYFKKKPVVIQAIQLTPETFKECHKFLGVKGNFENGIFVDEPGEVHSSLNSVSRLFIEFKTLEGNMRAHEGDWIIKGVKGEFYPCKPDIFEATYDLIGVDMEGEDPRLGRIK